MFLCAASTYVGATPVMSPPYTQVAVVYPIGSAFKEPRSDSFSIPPIHRCT